MTTEIFWPWWTYHLIARLFELIMAALVAYVAVQPLRYNQATLAEKQGADVSANSATKKSSLWMFAGRSLKNESIETLSAVRRIEAQWAEMAVQAIRLSAVP